MKRLVLVSTLGLLTLALIPSPADAQKKSYSVSNYDIVISVQENGDLHISETIRYEFTSGTFTFAYREIPIKGFDDIELVSLTSPDGPVSIEEAEVFSGWSREFRLRWTFPETNEPRTFRIDYIARGGLKSEDTENVVDWNAIGNDWQVAIRGIDVEVNLPWALTEIETDPPAEIRRLNDRSQILFHHDSLRRRTRYHIVTRFPEMVKMVAPVEENVAASVFMTLIPGGLIIAIVLGLFWRRVGKVESTTVSSYVTSYPEPGLSLGEAVYLVNHNTGNTRAAIPSIIFDMARRGILKIESTVKKAFLGIRSFDVRVRIIQRPSDLRPWESRILQAFEEESDLKKLSRKSKWMTETVNQIKTQLRAADLLSKEREAVRRRWLILSILIIIATSALFIFVMVSVRKEMLGLAIVANIGSLIFLVMSAMVETRSPRGVTLKSAFKSYGRGLREEIERLVEVDPASAAKLFIENLPAMVFDSKVNRSWIQKLKKKMKQSTEAFQLPEWMQLRDETGHQLATMLVASEFFGLFTESVSSVAMYAGGGYGAASGGAGAAGSGGGGGGGGAG